MSSGDRWKLKWGMIYLPQPHLWLGSYLKAAAGELHKGSHLEVPRAQSLLGGAQVWGFVMLAPRVALLTHWVGVGGISLSLEELSHQLAGLSTELSNPYSLT